MVIRGGRAAERDLKPRVRGRRDTAGDELAPCPSIVAFAPPGAPVVRQIRIIFRYHGPDSDDAGTVCAIDAPSVVPAAFVVEIVGEIVSAPVAAVVMSPPASRTYTLPGRES
jgi:hypothetical protein